MEMKLKMKLEMKLTKFFNQYVNTITRKQASTTIFKMEIISLIKRREHDLTFGERTDLH